MCIRDSYKDVDERTAAHELYGYKVALRDLGLLDREDCYVLPDTFGEAPGPLPKKPEELLALSLIHISLSRCGCPLLPSAGH